MAQRPMRRTKQKNVILSVLQNTKLHPTADWIYNEARKTLPDLSLGTVYRNLHVLKEMGEIQELNFSRNRTRFDGNPKVHDHFICCQCGQVQDLNISIDQELERKVELGLGAKVERHRLEFYGLCSRCRTEEQAPEE